MSFERVEQLKRDFTDKWVVVDQHTPELRRFVGLSGQIKTVNMSGRALVQFDNPVDISWYDIDLGFLKVIEGPLPKKAPEPKHEAKPAAAPAAKPAATGGKSPLELAREQAAKAKAAAGGGTAVPAKKSPLELAREQGAAKAKPAAVAAEAPPPAPEAVAAPEAPAAEAPTAPAAIPTTGPDGKPLSKLELARLQGAFKGKK